MTQPNGIRRKAGVLAVLGLLAACGTPTGATQAPTAGSTPAGSPAGTPEGSPGMTTAGASPSEAAPTGELKVGYPSAADYEDILMVEAFNRLNERGWQIENIFFANPEASFGALAQNQVQMGTGAVTSAFTSLLAGADLKIVGNQQGVPWAIVGTEEIQSCDDLANSVFAVHSPGGTTTTYPLYWARTACSPGTEVTPIYIEGSETRAAAMLAGEIEATIIGPAEIAFLEREAPGRFHVLVDFAQDETLAQLNSSVFTFSTSYVEENTELVAEILKEISAVYYEAKDDPTILADAAESNQLEYGETQQSIVKYQLDTGGLNPDLTITPESMQFTLEYFQEYGGVPAGLDPAEIADYRPLEMAGLAP